MMKTTLAASLAALCMGQLAHGAAFEANFDVGTDGFNAIGFDLSRADGLNGDGYLELYDNRGGVGTLNLSADRLSPLGLGGTISFDAIGLGDVRGTHQRFGEITLSGGGLRATYDAVAGVSIKDVWQTFTVSLDATNWGLSEQNFATLLENLTTFSMALETRNGLGERFGIDNFKMANANVPIPAGAFLFAPAAAAIYFRRQRRQGKRHLTLRR